MTTSKARFGESARTGNVRAENRRFTVTLQSRPLFTLFIGLHPVLELGQTPAGGRRIFPVSGGHFEGPRVKGTISPLIGSDLLLARADATFQQDVRLLLMPDDGSLILMTSRGVRRGSAGAADYYLRTTPYFETAAPAHAWLNGIVAVAKGARRPGGVEYEVFEIL
jgi:hypothetical protein